MIRDPIRLDRPAPSRPPCRFFTWEVVVRQYNLSMNPERTPPTEEEKRAIYERERRIYEEKRK
jgi:hypothetical protein